MNNSLNDAAVDDDDNDDDDDDDIDTFSLSYNALYIYIYISSVHDFSCNYMLHMLSL